MAGGRDSNPRTNGAPFIGSREYESPDTPKKTPPTLICPGSSSRKTRRFSRSPTRQLAYALDVR